MIQIFFQIVALLLILLNKTSPKKKFRNIWCVEKYLEWSCTMSNSVETIQVELSNDLTFILFDIFHWRGRMQWVFDSFACQHWTESDVFFIVKQIVFVVFNSKFVNNFKKRQNSLFWLFVNINLSFKYIKYFKIKKANQ